MGLNFGEHPDLVFDRAPLYVVLCQVRFPPVLSLMAAAGIAGFQQGLRETYPVLLPAELSGSIGVVPQGFGITQSAPVWRLTDEAKAWTVGIAADFVSLETAKYTDIGDFLGRFTHVLTVLHRTIKPADSIRIGLRKINLLPAQTSQSDEFVGKVRPELLGPLSVHEFPAPISGAGSRLQFVDADNVLTINYGLSIELPAPGGFVLDLDYTNGAPYQSMAGTLINSLIFSDGHCQLLPLGPRGLL